MFGKKKVEYMSWEEFLEKDRIIQELDRKDNILSSPDFIIKFNSHGDAREVWGVTLASKSSIDGMFERIKRCLKC